MIAVPRRWKRAAGEDAEKAVDGTVDAQAPVAEPADNGAAPVEPLGPEGPAARASEPEPAVGSSSAPGVGSAGRQGTNGHAILPDDGTLGLAEVPPPGALATRGPRLAPDPGLYAVLGLDPSASDAEIQTTYRRQAARLLGSGSNEIHALKQLNVAYEVLGNPVRRAEYDRLRLTPVASVKAVAPNRPSASAKVVAPVKRRRRPRQAVQPAYAGLGDVLVVLMVVGLAVLAGALIIPRVSINLTALNVVQSVLPLSNGSSRRAIEATATTQPAAPVATATPPPGLAARFQGSTVSVSDPTPARGTTESVVVRLRRDGQPAANVEVWSTVQYRTTEERWPATGSVKTDSSGAATIAFNIGAPTPDYPVTVRVFAQVNEQQLTWSTTFTPR
jgi:hypothetical protein